ncbi:uncharacterized protein LOC134530451 isoform X2 [Bacillus rossius redtenbacheri]
MAAAAAAAAASEEEGDAVPGLPPWAGRRFMEAVLRQGGEHSDFALKDVHFKRKATQDEGYASEIYFFSLRIARNKTGGDGEAEAAGAEREVALLLKSLPSGGKHQEFISTSSAFPREMSMYSETIPRLTRLLEQALPEARAPFAPRCYLCQERPRRLLVLEDLTAAGLRAHPRRGLDLAHSSALLRRLAQLHAASARLHELDPASMRQYSQSHITESAEARAHWGGVLSGLVRRLAAELRGWPAAGPEVADKLERFADNLMDRLAEVFRRDDDGFNVLNHGDLWVNNALFSYGEAGEVDDVRLIDYQSAHFASPAVDLQYFFVVDPDDEVRRDHCDALLREYHGELCSVLARLGCGRRPPSLAELRHALDGNADHALFLAATELAILLDDGFEFNGALPDGEGQREDRPMHSGEKYKQIFNHLLPTFRAKGIL